MSKKEYKIKVQTRKDEKSSELRKEGIIPAVLYGNKVKNQNFKLNRNEFEKVYNQIGEAGLIELEIDSKSKALVVVKEVQKNYVKNIFIHVDFYQVDMKKEIEVEVALNFIGESEAVKNLGGTLARNLETIKVRCLPGELVDNFDVDLSTLKTFEDKIRVSDLEIPKTITLITGETALVSNVLEPRIAKDEKDEKGEEAVEAEVKDGTEEKKEEGAKAEGDKKEESK